MSAVDFVLYGLISVIVGGLIIWFIIYSFADQTKPPSTSLNKPLTRLIGSTGRATSDITEMTETVYVNNEE